MIGQNRMARNLSRGKGRFLFYASGARKYTNRVLSFATVNLIFRTSGFHFLRGHFITKAVTVAVRRRGVWLKRWSRSVVIASRPTAPQLKTYTRILLRYRVSSSSCSASPKSTTEEKS